MTTISHISVTQVWQTLLDDLTSCLLDIRDIQSFRLAHPQKAQHLTSEMLPLFIENHDLEAPIYVICYHGISSQQVVSYLQSQGFEQVFNVEGGFAAWEQQGLPVLREDIQ